MSLYVGTYPCGFYIKRSKLFRELPLLLSLSSLTPFFPVLSPGGSAKGSCFWFSSCSQFQSARDTPTHSGNPFWQLYKTERNVSHYMRKFIFWLLHFGHTLSLLNCSGCTSPAFYFTYRIYYLLFAIYTKTHKRRVRNANNISLPKGNANSC